MILSGSIAELAMKEFDGEVTKGPTGIIHMPGGQKANRIEFDFYPTPEKLCLAALNLLPPSFNPISIMDPGAGDGPWGRSAFRRWGGEPWLYGNDIRDVPRPVVYDFWRPKQNYIALKDTEWGRETFDLVMGNPPYSQPKEMGPTNLAELFVRTGYASLRQGGYMVYLLRLAFLESKERGTGLWKDMPPQEVHVCVERPSFMPEGHPKFGKTDATAYAIYIWREGWQGETKLKWLSWK